MRTDIRIKGTLRCCRRVPCLFCMIANLKIVCYNETIDQIKFNMQFGCSYTAEEVNEFRIISCKEAI